jgi:hypothetical protein
MDDSNKATIITFWKDETSLEATEKGFSLKSLVRSEDCLKVQLKQITMPCFQLDKCVTAQ